MKKVITVFEKAFEVFTHKVTLMLGHPLSFLGAIIIVVSWISIDVFIRTSAHVLINDLIFSFTFLMVFIIQKMQNKFATVMNIKLNELVASHENASNRLIKVEDLTEKELRKLAAHYETLSATLGKGNSLSSSSSIEHVIEEIKKEEIEEENKMNKQRQE